MSSVIYNTINSSNTTLLLNNISSQNISILGGGGTLSSAGAIHVTNSTNATNSTSGCAILDGGLGVAKDFYLAGNFNVTGTTIFNNNTNIINTILYVNGSITGSPDAFGKFFKVDTVSFTDSATASSGTASSMSFNAFRKPTLNATNTSVTTTNSSTVYIQDAPGAGTNQTITNAWAFFVNAGKSKFQGAVVISDSTASTTTGTGCLTLSGGLGLLGAINAGSSISGTTLISTVSTGTAPLTVSSTTNVANLNASTVNGFTFANPGAIGSGTAATTIAASGIVTFSNSTASTNNSTGALVLSAGGLAIGNTTDSSSITNGGSLTSAGGFSFAKQGYIGVGLSVGNSSSAVSPTNTGVLTVFGNTTGAPSTNGVSMRVTSQTFNDSSTSSSSTSSSDVIFNRFGGPTITATNSSVTTTNVHNVYISGAAAAGSNQTITNSYGLTLDGNSVNVKSGSLFNLQGTISGSVSTSGSAFRVGAVTLNDAITSSSGTISNVMVSSMLAPTLTATNTNVTTSFAYTLAIMGAPIAGSHQTISHSYGLGVVGGIYCNGSFVLPYGQAITADPSVSNNINMIQASFGGSIGSYTYTGQDAIFYYCPGSSGGSSTSPLFALNANVSTFNTYVQILQGSTFTIYETSDATSSSVGGAFTCQGGGSFNKSMYIGNNLTINGIISSLNSTTGSLVLTNGGLSINCTTNAVSTSSGGGCTIAGGFAAMKDAYFGSNVYVNSINIFPSTEDIIVPLSFSAANNQSVAANVTSFAFTNSVTRSFRAQVSVVLIASSSLYAVYDIMGIQKGSSWDISSSYTGDNTGVTFSITTSGQIQYTSANSSGFTSLTFKVRCTTIGV